MGKPKKIAGIASVACLFVATFLATNSSALLVGDVPTLRIKALDGQWIDLQKLRGSLVVVDFWSVSDASKVNQAQLVSLKKAHADDPIVFIGICCDHELLRSQAMIKQMGMDWPQYWDGTMWNGTIPTQWDHRHIGSVLLGPDGVVLWQGVARNLAEPLAAALIAHTPTGVDPDIMTKADAALDQARKDLTDSKGPAALIDFNTIPQEAYKSKEFTDRIKDLQPQLDPLIAQVLAPVDEQIQLHHNNEALATLRDLSRQYDHTPASPSISQRMQSLLADPATASELQSMQRDSKAAAALSAAQALRERGEQGQAYLRFKSIVVDYANTEAAGTAASNLQAYRDDPQLMKIAMDQINGVQADSLLELARSYHGSDRDDLAAAKYREIITKFPSLPQAATARDELKAIENH